MCGSNTSLNKGQDALPARTLESLFRYYSEGHRNFSGSDLRGAKITEIMDKDTKEISLKEIILQGSFLTAAILGGDSIRVDFTGSDFSSCILRGVSFRKCKLDQCNFSNSDMRGVDIFSVSCRGSDFLKAKLNMIKSDSYSDFSGSNFTESDFSKSSLSGKFEYSNFTKCNMQDTIFNSFYSSGSDFFGSNFKGVKNGKNNSFQYSYYDLNFKHDKDFDPISLGMELLDDKTEKEE